MTQFDPHRVPRRLCAILAMFSLVGCGQQVIYNAPQFPFLKSYAAARNSSPVLMQNADWWARFGDPTLDALVARALSGSLTLAIARERVDEARAELRGVPGAASLASSASVQGQGTNRASDGIVPEGNLSFSWMLDPYGGRREQLKSVGAQVEMAAAEVDAARLLLLSNVTATYIDLRYSQRTLQLREQELRSRQTTLELIQTLSDRGAATQVDIVRAEALVAETRATLPSLRAAIESRKNELAALAGVVPGAPPLALTATGGQPRAQLNANVGIPADLLRNRPDIRIAERSYYAAVANVGVARAALYPQLSLGGAITLNSIKGIAGTEYYFGPTLQFPALTGGTQKAAVDVRASRARQAHTTWKSTVLGAILDVESALVTYSSSVDSVRASEKTVRLYRQLVDLTRDLITRDGATIRDLIDAEQSIANANITLAENLRQMARAFVVLNVSLGSGSIPPPPPTVTALQ